MDGVFGRDTRPPTALKPLLLIEVSDKRIRVCQHFTITER